MPSTHIYHLSLAALPESRNPPQCQHVSAPCLICCVTRTNSDVCCFAVIFLGALRTKCTKAHSVQTGTIPLPCDTIIYDLGPPFRHDAAKVLRTARRHKGQTRGCCEMWCAQCSQIQKCLRFLHTEKCLARCWMQAFWSLSKGFRYIQCSMDIIIDIKSIMWCKIESSNHWE